MNNPICGLLFVPSCVRQSTHCHADLRVASACGAQRQRTRLTYVTPRSGVVLKQPIASQLIWRLQRITESKHPLPSSRHYTTGLYPEPVQSSPHPFPVILPFTPKLPNASCGSPTKTAFSPPSLVRIREVPASNLCPETATLTEVLRTSITSVPKVRIREVPASNLCPETASLTEVLRTSSTSVPQVRIREVPASNLFPETANLTEVLRRGSTSVPQVRIRRFLLQISSGNR
jgi:glutaredoxin-related protein